MNATVTLEDRFVGAMLGLALGDAVGARFEGQTPDWIAVRHPNREHLIQRTPSDYLYYTDDTQMAIGVAEALLADGCIEQATLCRVFAENYDPRRGYGRGARVLLEAMQQGHDHEHMAATHFPGGSFGNGAAMRVAPVGLAFHRDLDRLWHEARLSSLPTHVHPLGIEGAQLLATAVALAVRGESLEREMFYKELLARCQAEEYRRHLQTAAAAESEHDLAQLGNGIAAHDSVVTAIACFAMWPERFEEVVAQAVLLGGDTDTIAAMAGAISGAHLGAQALPGEWLEDVEDNEKGRSYLANLGRRLAALIEN